MLESNGVEPRMPDLVETATAKQSGNHPLTRSASSAASSNQFRSHNSEEGLFEKSKNKVYASVAEMKRSKVLCHKRNISSQDFLKQCQIHVKLKLTPSVKASTYSTG